MSLETRSNSALMKRAEQLKRWQDSETCREPSEPKRKSRRIGFSDGCVFLAACAAGDREEVNVLLGRGADIDTANVDGLTALHQACIDDNLDMVEYLVANGADVNRGDNEGWTPLHATASCGFLSIAKFLLEHGANVAAVNNDGELAIDISESDEMEDLLQKEIDVRQINCEDARNKEEQCMLDDARDWYNSGNFGDRPHGKTGATALHVAAAKGYIKVINLLIQAGGEINQQDFDGWTPLHAAAHWAQREACELLAENYVNMDIKNCVGQTPFDVADPDVLRLLEELKKKQNTLQKDRPDIKALINRPPTTPGITNKGGRSLNNLNSNHVDIIRNPTNSANNVNAVTDRSSITRLSQQDKETIKQQVKETIKEEKVATSTNESDKDSSTDTSESDDSSLSVAVSPRVDPFHSDTDIQTARIYQSSPAKPSRTLDSPGVVVTDESGKEAPGFLPPHPETNQGKDDSAPWRRPGSLRARPTNSGLSGGKLSPSTEDLVTVRRAHSFGSDEKRKVSEDIITKQSPDLRPRSIENLSVSKSNPGAQPQPAQVRRSFVPPVRDEEHEIQRKAHAKRVRETRRSTQGVTLEDLKSAEQLVKKKQQQENAQRTTELQQLASSSPTSIGSTATPTTSSPPTPPGSTATTTVTTSATLVTGGSRVDSDQERHERRPSWRLRIETNDKSRFTLEDSKEKLANNTTSSQSPERRISRLDAASVREQRHSIHVPHLTSTSTQGESEGSISGTPTQLTAIQRKKKPKRRSTGVVQLELDDIDPRSEESADENVPTSSSQTSQEFKTRSSLKSQNGEIDYKKLWEESQAENARLRLDMNSIRSDLDSTRHQLEAAIQASAKNSVSDTEKREKKVLEKKLAEMEEELKTLDQLKADNQRLRDENGALIRVISKLSK
eukprot:TRINITY_DN120_c0_g1_i1.p1 TRINITY_DN120_c0_g1~~TRINITY_DN120_c0_g1_i1.p1  ORF type:complete len:902 (-),score=274.25 TRINITY_DN120_c0_g1_i1:836-3541(-)